ncbi:NADH-quinone oxidoreductase subunit NuoE [Buchnera aphidicola]
MNQNKLINKNFQLSLSEIEEIEVQKSQYEDNRAAIIEVLKIVQKFRGWISTDSVYAISRILNITASDIEEVATFYSNIYRSPVGRNIVKYCDSMVCYITGYIEIKNFLENFLKIKTGQTTIDQRFTLLPTCCLGACDRSPVIMINDETYFNVKIETISNLLEKYQ